MATEIQHIAEQGVLTLPDAAWERARQRMDVVGPLAALDLVGHQAADNAAHSLGLSRRQVYVLIRRARQGSGLVTDLARGQSSGGKGKGRLSEPVELIICDLLQKRFLTRQKRSLAALYREITQACKARKLRVPSRNTVALRIATLDPIKTARSRGGPDAARDLQGVGGVPPEVTAPLEQVQIDHTVIDLIIVDERDRQPIGRPYLTLAIDVFTRCVPGMVITLEAPSAVSVGLCLAHAACDKRPRLERLDVEMDWPMSGKPKLLYLDNAAEFKSEVLRRGCEQHGIELSYRPPGLPHFGGIVERIIGTAMQMIHELPGTTFSNPDQRGKYDSEGMAALTLHELERWLTLAIGAYHGSVHGTLLQPPAALWADAVVRSGTPAIVTHATAFLVDFLPAVERIQRIRADRWIGYPLAVEALNRLETLFAWPSKQRMPNLLLVGPTNNGKSMIIEKFRRTHPTTTSDDHEHIPVLCVQMPSEPSVTRFYVALLAAMGAPLRPRQRLPEMERLALSLLRRVGVRMLVIDELHNVLAGNSVSRREFLNLLRFLGNELRIPLVGVGTREAYLIIRSDDQLENRFEPIMLPLWEANDDCYSLLASFAASLPLRRNSPIATPDMARYLLTRSEGTIGELAHLLIAAAVTAAESGEEAINHRTLSMTDYAGPSERRRQFERELM